MSEQINPALVWFMCIAVTLLWQVVLYAAAYIIQTYETLRTKSMMSTLDVHSQTHNTMIHTLVGEQEVSVPGFLQVDLSEFVPKKSIAKGGSASIWLGQIISPELLKRSEGVETCIVKKLSNGDDVTNLELKASFEQEISLMWYFRSHKNFVKLYGYCSAPMVILMKYYETGSLGSFIHKRNKDAENPWTMELVLRFAYDIASGLAALHSNDVIHSDIKPENLLVDVDSNGKYYLVIADLGISCITDAKKVNVVKSFKLVRLVGASAPFAAPEVFQRLRFTDASLLLEVTERDVLKAADIYAFSLTLWEMITKRKAWKNIKSWEGIEIRVLAGERPDFPPEVEELCATDAILAGLVKIVALTWSQDPLLRMKMEDVLKELRSLANFNPDWMLDDVGRSVNSIAVTRVNTTTNVTSGSSVKRTAELEGSFNE